MCELLQQAGTYPLISMKKPEDIFVSDLFSDQRIRINNCLTSIERPGRYLGHEINRIKPIFKSELRVCLVFPDLYDIGISYYGYQVLYHLFNRIDGVACERAYLPWSDMQRVMQNRRIPLFALESGGQLSEFDLVCITLQTELHYPGVVKVLDLAGIPVFANERGVNDPLVIGGGPCAFHPEPVAPFFDAILTGDAEEAVAEIAGVISSNGFRKLSRRRKWIELADIRGMYAPGLYELDPSDHRRVMPAADVPRKIRSRIVKTLKTEFYPVRPLVPLVRGAHDRLTVEVMRGCTQGCRFCQAGMIHRPVRERPASEIVDQVLNSLETTGWNEVGLLSLSTSDYSDLENLLTQLSVRLQGKHSTLSFPSLRPASFSENIARIDTGGRRSTLTFAVEAGSERLRAVINKNLTEDDLFEAVERAVRLGWNGVKLYFMVGLPTETDDDVIEGALLLQKLRRAMPRRNELHVSVAPFIPKPHSIFGWEAYDNLETLQQRQRLLLSHLRGGNVKATWRNVEESLIETVLARGDRRMAQVIKAVAESGSGFETWSSEQSIDRWIECFDHFLPDWRSITGQLPVDEPSPWSHISHGILKGFMRTDLQRSREARRIPDCRVDECGNCGLIRICDELQPAAELSTFSPRMDDGGNDSGLRDVQSHGESAESGDRRRYRLRFTKLRSARFLGHHDLMLVVIRSLRRSGVSFLYSRGYSPRPRVSFAPAIPLGTGSVSTWIEFETGVPVQLREVFENLRRELPNGIKPLGLNQVGTSDSNQDEDGDFKSVRLRFEKPFNLLPGLEENHREIDITGLVEWSADKKRRTLYLKCEKEGARFPQPLKVASMLLQPGKNAGGDDHAENLKSVIFLN